MINVQNLVKEYKQVQKTDGFLSNLQNLIKPKYIIKSAVSNISFEIAEGELVGFIGPNGAGKSTSIKILTGILVPTSGEVRVNGIVPYKNRVQNAMQIGVVFGHKTQLWWDVPVIDSLKLLKDIYKVSEQQFKDKMELFCELLDIDEFINAPVRQLSLGQRMRADLAAAILHNPRILFLDEPTIGLDIVAKKRMIEFIKEINRKDKVTILLTTHDMNDIEKLANRMLIIDKGSLMYDGSVQDIKHTYGKKRTLIVEYENEIPELDIPNAALFKSEGHKKWYSFDRFNTSPSELINFISSKFPIVDLQVVEPEIEDMVSNIYNTDLNKASKGDIT